jgi:hypothetical protein
MGRNLTQARSYPVRSPLATLISSGREGIARFRMYSDGVDAYFTLLVDETKEPDSGLRLPA